MRALFIISLLAVAGCKDNNTEPDVVDAHRADAPTPDAPIDAAPVCFNDQGTPEHCFDQSTCEPTQLADFLNSCTDGSCIKFDNVARLTRYNNGSLPPLP